MHTIWIWVILFRWFFFWVPSFPCKFKGVIIIIIIIIIFTSEQYFIVQMDLIFFIQSLVEGHLGCFQVLVIANNGTMKMVEQMPLCSDWAYFQYMTKIGIGEFWGTLFPNFLRHHHMNINGALTSLYSHQQYKSVPVTTHPLQHKLSSVFLILAILTGMRWNLRVFWFSFL